MTSSLHYKGEIDGLRAISVLIITLYHLDVGWMGGGFVGVDVFFVISGFLITGIIVEQLDSGNFRLGRFYLRRSARILPPLLVVVLLSLVAAAYFQQPDDLLESARQGAFASLSLSNFYFWNEISYWSGSADLQLFLHTWSLGVEEQFYLFFPFLLIIAHRLAGVGSVSIALILLFLGGLLANDWVRLSDPSAAFYWSPLRLYEFALGGVGAVFYQRMSPLIGRGAFSLAITSIGLAMIFYAATRFQPMMPLPGYPILLPCVGALLVILAGSSPVANFVLANKPMRWLGKISYSIYLVHWPLLVLYRYENGQTLSVVEQLVLFLTILVLAQLLHVTVEQRWRLGSATLTTPQGTSWRRVRVGIVATLLLSLGLSSLIIAGRGLPERYPEAGQRLMSINSREVWKDMRHQVELDCLAVDKTFCRSGETTGKTIWLLADSRGLEAYMALRKAYPEATINLSWRLGCAPVLDRVGSFSPFPGNCYKFNRSRLERVLDAPEGEVVFLAQSFLEYRRDSIFKTARKLVRSGKRVYLLGDMRITDGRSPLDVEIEATRRSDADSLQERYLVDQPFSLDAEYSQRAAKAGAAYISLEALFAKGESYRFVDQQQRFLSYDGKHLTEHGARTLGDYLQGSLVDPWQ